LVWVSNILAKCHGGIYHCNYISSESLEGVEVACNLMGKDHNMEKH